MTEGITYSAPFSLGEWGLGSLQFQQVLALYENGLLEKCICGKDSQHIIPKRYIVELGKKPDEIFDRTVVEQIFIRKETPKNFLGWLSPKQQKYLRQDRNRNTTILKYAGSTYPLIQSAMLERESVIQKLTFGTDSPPVDYYSIRNAVKECENIDAFLCSSNFVKNSFELAGFNPEKLDILHLGVDTNFFYPNHMNSETFRVLFIGTNWFRKGLNYAVDAYNKLNTEKKHFIARTNAIANAKNSTFYPRGGDSLKYLYDTADVFLLPSIEDGFGMVVTEAMSCGLPVITTNTTGASELIEHGKNGFIMSSPVLSTTALQQIYDNRDKLQDIGKNARETAKKYTWESYRKNFAKWIGDNIG